MKRVEFFIGSPRRNGNTVALCRLLEQNLAAHNFQTGLNFLYDYEIKPCTDCRFCKKGNLECKIKDNAVGLYQKIENADYIVFATPIYWFGPTAKMKLLVDRLRPFYASKRLEGKSIALILAAGSGHMDCDLTIEAFKRIAKALDMNFTGSIEVEAYDVGDVEKNINIVSEIDQFSLEFSEVQ